VYKEFVPEGQTVNSEFPQRSDGLTCEKLRCVRLDKTQSDNWFLLQNYAPSHIATIIKQFPTKKSITVLTIHLFTRFGTLDYFLFPKVKSNLRGTVLTPL
jgi:hypothetical protein